MNKTMYYGLLDEYQKLIEQKRFNEFSINRPRLDAVKETLCQQLSKQEVHILCDEIRDVRRFGMSLEMSTSAAGQRSLRSKITGEESIEEKDFANTYYPTRILFGLTLRELVNCVLVGTVVWAVTTLLATLFT